MTDFNIEASWAEKPYFYRAPFPVQKTPYPFQLAGPEYALARPNALIGDEPGLGKTMQAILVSNAIEARRTLVVVPATLRLNWEREIWQWSTIPNVTVYPVMKSADGVSYDHDYVVISYALLSNPSILQAVLGQLWDHLILDEAHALKAEKINKRTQVIVTPNLIPSVVGRITLLSGTILPNQPIECYNALRLMDWDCIDRISVKGFRNSYYTYGSGFVNKRVQEKGKWVYKPVFSDHVQNVPVNLRDLQYRLRKNVMVRRLIKDVMPQLPPITWHMFPLALTPELRRVMKHPGWRTVERLYDADDTAFDAGVPIDGAVSTARLELGMAKAPGVVAFARELHASGVKKIVLGAWHTVVLEYIVEELKDLGVVYMKSNMSPTRKQTCVDTYMENPDMSFIIGQTLVLGVGHNLHAGFHVIDAEPDWVPGNNEQLARRVVRIGQTSRVAFAHIPVVPDSMDERILSRAINKAQNTYEALDATA